MASEAMTWMVDVEEEEGRGKRRVKVGQLGGFIEGSVRKGEREWVVGVKSRGAKEEEVKR